MVVRIHDPDFPPQEQKSAINRDLAEIRSNRDATSKTRMVDLDELKICSVNHILKMAAIEIEMRGLVRGSYVDSNSYSISILKAIRHAAYKNDYLDAAYENKALEHLKEYIQDNYLDIYEAYLDEQGQAKITFDLNFFEYVNDFVKMNLIIQMLYEAAGTWTEEREALLYYNMAQRCAYSEDPKTALAHTTKALEFSPHLENIIKFKAKILEQLKNG